ncbi:MAG: glycoside hydrolase family 98 domain-containing protein [Candidatus Hydrogenedentota bacterium]
MNQPHTRAAKRLAAHIVCAVLGGCAVLNAQAGPEPGSFPALRTEISPEHPLFLFAVNDPARGDTALYIDHLQEAWETLPAALKPYTVLAIDAPGPAMVSRHERYLAILGAAQAEDIPVVITIADGHPARYYPLPLLEELLMEFTCLRGAVVSGLRFNSYDPAAANPALGMPPVHRWLAESGETLARYGCFLWMPLDELGWPRLMANTQCARLYKRLRALKGYLLPGVACRGDHVQPQVAAAMGLWLTQEAAHWGIAPDARWYADARFDGPGRFGGTAGAAAMPSGLYSAMILTGAMTGAAIYAFPHEQDLWFGTSPDRWNDAIAPLLRRLVDQGLIARRDSVRAHTPVACRLAEAATPRAFHVNLRDIDGVLDAGHLAHAAYGMERPGQVPELIPNRRYFYVPLLPAHTRSGRTPANVETDRDMEADTGASEAAPFDRVVSAGTLEDAEAWEAILAEHTEPFGAGTAYIARVGRGIFVMNTRENVIDPQTFVLEAVPAPVRGVMARRTEAGVTLSWPFREGDVSYKVHRRILPDGAYETIAEPRDDRRHTDTAPPEDENLAYAVTALTNETEPYEGTVGYTGHRVLSTVESRIAEEVVLAPVQVYGEARPVAQATSDATWTPWWPNLDGLDGPHRRIAEAIAEEIAGWGAAIAVKDLDATVARYARGYTDPAGWSREYARRAWQWCFERFEGLHVHRQIREWDFSAFAEAGRVRMLLYFQVTGHTVAGPAGHLADRPVRFPREEAGETWLTFVEEDGLWRIRRTDPALPNFRDFLAEAAPPNTPVRTGPDVYPGLAAP